LSVIRRRQQRPEIYRAGLAVLIGMLTKNLTDDFMWQSTMLISWALSGWLLAQCEPKFFQALRMKWSDRMAAAGRDAFALRHDEPRLMCASSWRSSRRASCVYAKVSISD
jgi:hypothetical protein